VQNKKRRLLLEHGAFCAFGEEYEKKISFLYKEPTKSAWTAIVIALVSMVIIPILSVFSILSGFVGVYFSVKNKAGFKAIGLNFLAIILGFTSQLLQILVSGGKF
jgi:hypothetical protein